MLETTPLEFSPWQGDALVLKNQILALQNQIVAFFGGFRVLVMVSDREEWKKGDMKVYYLIRWCHFCRYFFCSTF
jgi:hypothetical protein